MIYCLDLLIAMSLTIQYFITKLPQCPPHCLCNIPLSILTSDIILNSNIFGEDKQVDVLQTHSHGESRLEG